MAMTSSAAMIGVGVVEALIGGAFVLVPSTVLPCLLGRTLTVGNTGVAPLVATAGALRLTVAAFLLAIGACGVTGSVAPEAVRVLAAVAVLYCGLLKTYVLLFRSHKRMPTSWQAALALLEAAVLVGALAADGGFQPAELAHQVSFVFSAVVFICSLLLVLVAASKGLLAKNPTAGPDVSIETPELSSGLLFDDTRHTLSPASRRLLQ
ncbi:hypothetical protein AB1Y20_020721 [Prymnesium parvum]|uniref:Uncharacterized protein n=1 Tax=Prymnesium parvum TaxID=97485 RepID=A0AB34JY77_PRYPA